MRHRLAQFVRVIRSCEACKTEARGEVRVSLTSFVIQRRGMASLAASLGPEAVEYFLFQVPYEYFINGKT